MVHAFSQFKCVCVCASVWCIHPKFCRALELNSILKVELHYDEKMVTSAASPPISMVTVCGFNMKSWNVTAALSLSLSVFSRLQPVNMVAWTKYIDRMYALRLSALGKCKCETICQWHHHANSWIRCCCCCSNDQSRIHSHRPHPVHSLVSNIMNTSTITYEHI